MVMICWGIITRCTQEYKPLTVSTKYKAALSGPGYVHGYDSHCYRCRAINFKTTLLQDGFPVQMPKKLFILKSCSSSGAAPVQ